MKKFTKVLTVSLLAFTVIWVFGPVISPEIAAQQRLLVNGLHKGRATYFTGELFDFADNSMTPNADGTEGMGDASNFWAYLFADKHYMQKGADVASAASSFAVGSDGTVFDITGTTNLDSLAVDAIGRLVILHFDGVLTVTDGGNLELTGNHVTEAADILCLYQHTATNWRELFRIDQTP